MFYKRRNTFYNEVRIFGDWLEEIEKKNYESIDKIKNVLLEKLKWVVEHDKSKDKYIEAMDSQQRTIEALTNALCDKYKHGLFIYSEDGKLPMVIRNGKELTNDMTTEFSICWCLGEVPNIQIEQCAATHHEDGEN